MRSRTSIGKAVAMLLIILILCTFVPMNLLSRFSKTRCEGFDLSPMKISSMSSPLLPNYRIKNNPALTDYGAQEIATNYPIFPANSYFNNNIKYWRRPTNGTCSPADFCGSLYINTSPTIPQKITPPPCGVVRVNYYASHE